MNHRSTQATRLISAAGIHPHRFQDAVEDVGRGAREVGEDRRRGPDLGRRDEVRPRVGHADRLGDRFRERRADPHHLAHGLHRRAEAPVGPLELVEVPARKLDDHVVERRFEARGGDPRDPVLQLGQRVAERELGRDVGERVAGRLARERARAGESRVDLDRVVLLAGRVEAELDVALADDPARLDRPQRGLPEHLVLVVRERLAGGDDDVVARVHAHAEHVLHVAHGERIAPSVPDDLVLELLPGSDVPLEEDLSHGARAQPARDHLAQLGPGVGDSAALASEGVGDPHHHREAELLRRLPGRLEGVDGPARQRRDPGLRHDADELLAVLGRLDRPEGGSKDPRARGPEGPLRGQLDAAVERRLPPERDEDPVGPLLGEDRGDELGREGLEVHPAETRRVGLERGDVRVDDDGVDALLFEGLEALATGVVELAGLPDLERTAPEEQHLARQVGRHARRFTLSTKRSKTNPASCGPGWPSG